jgi:transposase InsO family protein
MLIVLRRFVSIVLRLLSIETAALIYSKRALAVENEVLRIQLHHFVDRQAPKRRTLAAERAVLGLLSRRIDLASSLVIVKPETVLRWHRELGRWLWARRSRRGGRPPLPFQIRRVIKQLIDDNPTWSAERIRDEASLKLGCRVSATTVRKYLKLDGPSRPSSGWRRFLTAHTGQILACDFAVTHTWGFRRLFVFLLMDIHSRKIVHAGVVSEPTSRWVANQIRHALPGHKALPYRFLIHDGDSVFTANKSFFATLGLQAVKTPPRTPQANGFVERLVGTLRRELLDHVIPLNELHLQRLLDDWVEYYNTERTHMSLDGKPPDLSADLPFVSSSHRHCLDGEVLTARSFCAGLHHAYRLAA